MRSTKRLDEALLVFWESESMLLECKHCEAMVDAKELFTYEYEEVAEGYGPFDTKVTFAKCPACDAPLLAGQINTADGWDEPDRFYPPMDRELYLEVPDHIVRAFTEARTCLRAKAYTAAAIMCRKTLEGICSEHGVRSSGTLAAQLKKLKENGVIENRLFEWAEELRTMGNEAAHGVEFVVSRDDARDTLEFTEALIEYVFTYRDKFENFKKRRAKATSPPKEARGEKQKGSGQ
jgi:hypothetical protein